MDIKAQTYKLIDDLKAVCHNYGMGNDGNEYKVITQIFLYKFLNDKFGYEIKKKDSRIASAEKWETAYSELPEDDRLDLLDSLSPDIPRLYPEHLISTLWNQQAKGDFDLIFDSTMVDIADKNIDIFSTQTTKNTKIPLFEKLTNFVTDDAQRAPFARALVDKLVNFSFEDAFAESYDFFAGVFEYVIKDYNTNGGGVYAEYYTPHAIAVIMARLLVGDRQDLHNIECYDPAAGTGTLLMALAHQIGEDRCTIFAQDRSQKSNKMLKLNLILNGLVSSLDHAIQGDTLTDPFHMSDDGKSLRQFDYESATLHSTWISLRQERRLRLCQPVSGQVSQMCRRRKREHVHLHMLPSACAEFDETKRKSCDCTSNWFPHGKEQRRGQTAEAYCKRETCIWRYQYAVQCFCKYRYECIRCVLR